MLRKTNTFGSALSRGSVILVYSLCIGLFACSGKGQTTRIVYQGNPTPETNPNVRFIAIGDTGRGNRIQFQVANAMKEKCIKDECDFVLLLGDNIYNDGVASVNDSQFQSKFELPYQDIEIPFYLALGNHDYGGDGTGTEVEKPEFQIEYSRISKKWKMPNRYYRFEKQNVTFVALDTNAQMFANDANQREDVRRWITDSNSQWKIAFGHHPYLSNGPHGNAGQYDELVSLAIPSGEFIKRFADSIWCGNVDLYLAGHDHSRQWLEPTCQGTQLVVSGTGSSTTNLPGSNTVLYQSNTPGFLYVHILGNTLKAEFIDIDGHTAFSRTITK